MSEPTGKDNKRAVRVADAKPTPGRELNRVVEAVLFIGTEPLQPEEFCRAFPGTRPADVERAVDLLARRYRRQRRPYTIQRTDRGYVLKLDRRHQEDLLGRSRSDRGFKLPRAAIEVLSVVAYRQPIDRAAVDELVGIDPRPALRQLLKRDLIKRRPAEEGEGEVYVTTARFLEVFRLESLGDLPVSADLQHL